MILLADAIRSVCAMMQSLEKNPSAPSAGRRRRGGVLHQRAVGPRFGRGGGSDDVDIGFADRLVERDPGFTRALARAKVGRREGTDESSPEGRTMMDELPRGRPRRRAISWASCGWEVPVEAR